MAKGDAFPGSWFDAEKGEGYEGSLSLRVATRTTSPYGLCGWSRGRGKQRPYGRRGGPVVVDRAMHSRDGGVVTEGAWG